MSKGNQPALPWVRRISMLFAISVVSMPSMVAAQIPATPAPTQAAEGAQPCQVIERAPGIIAEKESAALKSLSVACGSWSTWLGFAVSYESAYNPGLRSLAVALRDGLRTRVLLIVPTAKGRLRVDDVSREFASLSGRLPDLGLIGVPVDLSNFAATGRLSVPVHRMDAMQSIGVVDKKAAVFAAAKPDIPATGNASGVFDLTSYLRSR